MNVLSLFDGASCGQVALERVGIKVDNYFASEIDPYAIKVTQKNYPKTIQLGDVTKWYEWDLPKIDLIIGGSPCQGFSASGKGLNFNDPRSKLFFEFTDVLNAVKPKNFLLENVKMKKQWERIITNSLYANPIEINSSLVSGQKRRRLYWTDIAGVEQPKDKGILLNDILLDEVDDKFLVSEQQLSRLDISDIKDGGAVVCFQKPGKNVDKSECLMARDYKGISGKQYFTVVMRQGKLYKLTPVEYERLQTLPDNYTDAVSNTQRYKMIGNGWTVDVLAHIFKGLKTGS